MFECVDGIRSLDDLRNYIHEKLCSCENLVRAQFMMSEMLLPRRGRACGLQFSLQGPRSVRLAAIWPSAHNVMSFYYARGTRSLKVNLRQRPSPDAA